MGTINYEYSKSLTAVKDKVVIEKLERYHEKKFGDIVLPDNYEMNARLCKGKVVSVGPDAAKEGLKPGDIVLYDTFSVFYDTHPIVVTKVENIICFYNENE